MATALKQQEIKGRVGQTLRVPVETPFSIGEWRPVEATADYAFEIASTVVHLVTRKHACLTFRRPFRGAVVLGCFIDQKSKPTELMVLNADIMARQLPARRRPPMRQPQPAPSRAAG